LPDVAPVAVAFAAAMAALLGIWAAIALAQKTSLLAQVQAALELGRTPTEDDLAVDTSVAAQELLTAMISAAGSASALIVEEAAAQHADVTPVQPPPSQFVATAEQTTTALADELKKTAAETARSADPSATVAETVDEVAKALDKTDNVGEHRYLGAAVHGAMNTARTATVAAGPVGAIYASEHNDARVCLPCHEIDGRWLGNTDDMAMVLASYPGGAFGGYVGCLGGDRCRGTITGVWRGGTAAKRVTPPLSPLAAHIASGEKSATLLGGGMQAKTELVTFDDGGQAVRKTVLDDGIRDRVSMQDAEQLAAIFAGRLGIDAPEVQREASNVVYMEFISDARTGMDRYGWGSKADSPEIAELTATDQGRRLGLFDLAIGNVDRNDGNWLITSSGGLVAIDHGAAFEGPSKFMDATGLEQIVTGPGNVFAHNLGDNYSHADVEHLRQVLDGMLPVFQKMHRLRWYNDTRVRLAMLDDHAAGDGSVF
jgi:Phosphatidylinositol 3- and 4-kinase